MILGTLLDKESSLTLLFGDDNFVVDGISSAEYLKENSLVFIKDKKYLKLLIGSASKLCFGVVTTDRFYNETQELWSEIKPNLAFVITSENMDVVITKVSKLFFDDMFSKLDLVSDGRVSKTAVIDDSAKIAKSAFIGDNVVIGAGVQVLSGASILAGSIVGDNTVIFPNVTIYSNVKIGKNCRIHSSSVVGADGFGYNFFQGIHHKIWHIGGVVIEDDVEIGTMTAVDSGTFVPTVVESGTKLDNHVQVAHNCRLGKGSIMCGQSGLGGSAELGDYVVIGGKVGIGPAVKVGAQSQIAGSAMVTKDCGEKSILAGFPARNLKDWLKTEAYIRRMSLEANK